MDFNLRFSGNYDLFKWILKKYENQLPYSGQVKIYSQANNYSENTTWKWRHIGLPPRAWNGLHKDLVIARLMGRIKDHEVMNLEELKKEYIETL